MLQIKCWSFTCYFVVPDTFNKHFSKYGDIIDSVIMKDKNTHMPRGFGFVTFADPSVIDRVLEDEHVIDGRTVGIYMKLFLRNFLLFKQPPLISFLLIDFANRWHVQVEVKRTVPREDMPSKAGIKTKKIFVGGIPTALTEGRNYLLCGDHVLNFGN